MVKKCTICKCEMEERRMIGLFTGRMQYYCPQCYEGIQYKGEAYASHKTSKVKGQEIKRNGKINR